MLTAPLDRLARALRRAALPLGCYYAVTLLVPLANGAGRFEAGFAAHAAVVAFVPLVLIAVVAALGGCVQLAARACRSAGAFPRARRGPRTRSGRGAVRPVAVGG